MPQLEPRTRMLGFNTTYQQKGAWWAWLPEKNKGVTIMGKRIENNRCKNCRHCVRAWLLSRKKCCEYGMYYFGTGYTNRCEMYDKKEEENGKRKQNTVSKKALD